MTNKEYPQFIQDAKEIRGEFQHALVIADIHKRKIIKVVRKTFAERRKTSLLKDVKIMKRFEEKVTELVKSASGGVGIQVKVKICQKVLDGFGMAAEWALSIVVPIFKGKGDIKNCSCHIAVKFLEHDMKVVEMVF